MARNILKRQRKKIKDINRDYAQTPEFRQKMSSVTSGKNNAMWGKSVYSIWLRRYGKEEADNRKERFKQKQSANSSGSNNHMFGRPSPHGSGNGWSGWYKGWYFRSLHELNYVVSFLEPKGISWVSGENEEFRIKYIDWRGVVRNYHPDFFVNGHILVECKPKKLWKSALVVAKAEAATQWAKDRGFEYQLVDPGRLDAEAFKVLHDSGQIKFIDRYETKYQQWLVKQDSVAC